MIGTTFRNGVPGSNTYFITYKFFTKDEWKNRHSFILFFFLIILFIMNWLGIAF